MKRFAPLLVLVLAAAPASAQEQPTGGTVASGAASISQDATTTTIDQSTNKAVINWESFNIGAGTTTRFNQPGANSVTLNRTMQNDPSRLFGNLEANGNVMILNPHGVLFGPSSRVDVNGLMVSTGTMADEDFNAGRYQVEAVGANPDAAIVNRGEITLKEGGWAALVAPRVENAGTIRAPLGRVALGSGEAYTLDLRGDGLIKFRAPLARAPDGGAALVTNTGTIAVEGGTVNLDARAVEGLVESVVNVDGVIRTSSARVEGGKVILSGGDHGIVEVRGDISARSERAGDEGGRVVVTGERIDVKASASIDASGHSGGGDIEIGGDLQGEQTVALGETRRNADAVRIEEGATIKADALDVGDGGRIIVWADGWTAAAADLSARGGMNAGNGGFIEVSGKEHLVWRGLADLRAPGGEVGTLLLDPNDIVISTGGTSADITPFPLPTGVPGDVTIEGTGAASTINITQLLDQLAFGNVTITTATGTGGTGNITILDPIAVTGAVGAGTTLTLNADNDILVSATGGLSSVNALNVTMTAANAVQVSSAINTAGGAVTVNAQNGVNLSANVDSGGGDIAINADSNTDGTGALTVNGDIIAGTGTVELLAGDGITVNLAATISASGATTVLNADVDGNGTGLLGIDGTVNAGTGALTLEGGQFALGGFASIDGAGSVRIQPSDDATTVGVAGGAGFFGIGAGELDRIDDGFDEIIIGRDTSQATLTLGDYDFKDSVRLIGGDVSINTGLTVDLAFGGGDITIQAVDESLAMGDVNINPAVMIETNGGALLVEALDDIFISDVITAGGDVTLNADSNGSGAGELSIDGDVDAMAGAMTLTGATIAIGATGEVDGSGTLTIAQSADDIMLGVGTGAGAFSIDNAELGRIDAGFSDVTIGRFDNTMPTTVAGLTNPFDDPITFLGGSGGLSVATFRTNGVTATVQAPTITAPGNLFIDTTNVGAVPTGANIAILGDADLGANDLVTDAGTTGTTILAGTMTNINAATFSGANVSATDLNATSVNVGAITNAATLNGTINSLNDAAAAALLVVPAGDETNVNYTFDGFTVSGIDTNPPPPAPAPTPTIDDSVVGNPDPDSGFINGGGGGGGAWTGVINGGGGGGGFTGGGGGAVSPGLADGPGGDVLFAEIDDADFRALREINEEASASDSALLGGQRGGLVAEILSALDRKTLTEDGAPAGPYGEPTTLIPGVLVYDPEGGIEEEEIDPFRPPVFGALEGW